MFSPKLKLNNGIEMPQIGLGVYEPELGADTKQAVLWALEVGYRHIDTAAMYKNERQVGEAIRESGVPRNEIFVTTKVADGNQGFENTLAAYQRSLQKLGLDFVDLYLIHWPIRGKRKETWRAFEKIYAEKRVRAIGVSNYLVPHLEELFSYANVIPAINQIEFTPYCYEIDTLKFCQKHGIQLESYSPLVRGLKQNDTRLTEIAKNHGKSTYKVLLRWAIQHGIVTIPKSNKIERLRENIDVFDFELSDEEMNLMNTFNDGTRVAPNPMEFL